MPPNAPKAPRRFDVEHALTIDCDYVGMVAPAHLRNLDTTVRPVSACNLYAIARRPRVSINPQSFKSTADAITMDYFADWGDGEPAHLNFELPNPWASPLTLETKGADGFIVLNDEDGSLMMGVGAAAFLSEMLRHLSYRDRAEAAEIIDANLLDLEVVYVGQSQDPQGAAQRRLKNHATLQSVLADSSFEAPHLELVVLLMSFHNYTNLGQFGPWSGEVGPERSEQHIERVHATPPPEGVRTALAEAALIRHFRPLYNDKFKESFPSALHSTYRHVYDLEYNAVGIEMETMTTISTRLKSGAVEPSFIQSTLFQLEDPSARRSFFDIWDVEGDGPAQAFLNEDL